MLSKIIFFFFLFSSVAYGIVEKQKHLEKVSLQLHWKYQFEFAGFIMAKEKGFYKDVGLDVELKEYTTATDIIQEVLDQKVNYGIYNSRLLLEYLKGKPVVLLASFFKRSALVLITQPEIEKLSDLKGKKVMAGTKKDFLLNFEPYLEQNDVDVDDLILVPHTYSLEPFITKKVSAMTAFISDQPYRLKKVGKKFNIFDPSKENMFVMQLELFTSKKELMQHPQRTKRFVLASIKGWEYALSHKKEAIDIIYKKYNRGLSKEQLLAEAKAIEKLILPYTYEIGSIDKGFIQKQAKLFLQRYHLHSDKIWDDYVYNPYEQQAIALTYKEQKYLHEHPIVRVCPHPNLFPIDGIEKNKHTGIMGDIFDLIAKKTGLHFQVVQSDDIKELQQKVVQKGCDVLSIATKSITRRMGLYATKVVYKGYFTVITGIDKSFIKDSDRFLGKRLLIKDPYLYRYIKILYPFLHLELMTNEKKMVELIEENKAYGIVTLDAQSDYFIDEYGFGKLKIGGFLAKEHPLEGVIGIQKQKKVLASIIQKALYSISDEKLRDIANSWHMTRYHTKIDYKLLLSVFGVMGIIVGMMFYYQRRMKQFNNELEQKVAIKTQELRQLNLELEKKVQAKVEEIIQKDRLLAVQSKQAIMGEMITMIAHQWRQPLNTLTLQISNLQLRRMMGELVDISEYDKTLEQISKTITYLSETIDDFQTFFHPDRELQEISLYELVQKAYNFILPRLKGTNIKVAIDIPKDMVVKVYINELIQVLLNILNNAIDALLECHKEQKRITITATLSQDKVKIYITDTACGIDADIIDKLFEPYFSTKGKNGTGLGLYMSQMIMQKQFGGDISVVSSPNGTTFTTTFPKLR